ncbi:hypothetical protein BOX15_Mlig023551g2 [Macrostomum lignano]|uniref:Uncharacterized protein n=1 Tax=Macrostomum lignano TaxID=282301 RepID=A0A267GIQ1_9PLAT|nr:hypothetical protein BOX15_Mlig023551g2 [Macrostomum lignano]
MLLRDLHIVTQDTLSAIQWLAKYHLLANTHNCPCGTNMRLQRRQVECYINGYAWDCRVCHAQVNIRKGSFFKGSHLKLVQIVDLTYWWSMETKLTEAMSQCGIGSWSTIMDWHQFLRDICQQFLIDHPLELGSPGKEVEINESKFMHLTSRSP